MPSTTGTNTPATRSASRCTGALEPWAASTRRTIWARAVSAPTRVARTTSRPSRLTVAPVTSSPGPTSTGTDSPVSSDRSTEERPSTTTPSVASFWPGRTTNRSPTATASTGTGTSAPSRSTMAVPVPSSSRRRRAWPDRLPGARLQPAAEQDQDHDDGRDLEVHVGPAGLPRGRVAGTGGQQRRHRPAPGGQGAQGDQRVHGRGPVAQPGQGGPVEARQPAQSTTGVARTAASQAQPGYCSAGNMARARTGPVRAAAATRRVRSASAGSAASGSRPTA